MLDEELIQRPEPQQHGHAAIATVAQATPPGARPILTQGQRANIAKPASIQVPRGAVVHGMGLLPILEGKQGNQTETGADPLVGPPAGEIGAMTAVVLDDEQAHIHPGGR